jgi:hypothetical protein
MRPWKSTASQKACDFAARNAEGRTAPRPQPVSPRLKTIPLSHERVIPGTNFSLIPNFSPGATQNWAKKKLKESSKES